MGKLLKLGLLVTAVIGSSLASAQTTNPPLPGQYTYTLVSSSITTTLDEDKFVGQNIGAGANTHIGIELQCYYKVEGSTEGCPWSAYFQLANNTWSEIYDTYDNVPVGQFANLYADHQVQSGTETWKRSDSNVTTYSHSLDSSIFSGIYHLVEAQ